MQSSHILANSLRTCKEQQNAYLEFIFSLLPSYQGAAVTVLFRPCPRDGHGNFFRLHNLPNAIFDRYEQERTP